jgi:hypothetical protein
MSLFSDTPITLHQLSGKLKEMASRLSEDKFRDDLMPHAGRVMVNVIRLRFSRGAGPNGEKWMSTAPATQFGGRWSAKTRRPKGRTLSSGSIRLYDKGDLMRSYTAVIDGTRVEVGPRGDLYETIAEAALTNWKNAIAGWDDESTKMVEKEIKAFLKRALA